MDSKDVGIGALVMTFVAVIVALSLLSGSGGIASNVGTASGVSHVENLTKTLGAVGVGVELPMKVLIGTPVVENFTNSAVVPATNYTFYEGVGADGVKAVFIKADGGGFENKKVNITTDYGGDGYAEEAATRAIAPLIIIFAVLAIAVIVLVPILRGKLAELMS